MRKALDIFIDDFKKLKGNIIAIVIMCGLILLPSLYVWFSLLAFWNPEGHTGDISVAVANQDVGYRSDLIPTKVNAGSEIVEELRADPKFDWVFVDEEKAIDGVKSGKYYAAIVIPEDFSADMVSVFSEHVQNPSISYYVNEKINPIAPHLTSIGASTIQEDIDQTFTSTITNVALGTNSNLAQFMEGKGISSYANTLLASLSEAIEELRGDAGQVRAFSALISQTETLVETSSKALSQTSDINNSISPLVKDTKAGLDSTIEATDGIIDLASAAFSKARNSIAEIQDAANKAFDTMEQDPAALQTAISSLQEDLQATKSAYENAYNELKTIDPSSALLPAISAAIKQIETLEETLDKVSEEIGKSASDISDEREKVSSAIDSALSALDDVQSQYGQELKDNAAALKAKLDALGADTVTISQELEDAMSMLAESTSPLVTSMKDICSALDETASLLDSSASTLSVSNKGLSEALDKNDMEEVNRIIGNDPGKFANILAAPATIEKHPVYPVANFGSAISPFYTSLGLFIAVIFIMVVLKVKLSPARRKELGDPTPAQEYFGHGAFLFLITLAQALLICTGNLFYLGVQCESIPLYYLTGIITVFVFFNIIYSLCVAFGNLGRALSVILLVLQIAGSGGELPIQLSSQIFQNIYPWLPFTHSMNMFQGAIAGIYGDQFLISLCCLLGFLIPAFIVGLVLRRPIMKLNDRVDAQLEKTGVM